MSSHAAEAPPIESLLAHLSELRGFLVRRLGDEAAAEDVLQDTLTRALTRVEALRDPAAARAWFYRALRNALVDRHRRQGAAQRALEAFAAELEVAAPSAEDEVVCRCVSRLAEALSPSYAEALRRTAVDEVPLRQYAEEVGIARGNAAVRAFRAREALRREVRATCGSCAERGCGDCTCEAAG
jgi:RNA polymerase sigma-70 factor (ECF subfamily)